MLQITYICFFKHAYRLFPLHELAFCKLLIRYKLKPEHPCVTAMPEEDAQSMKKTHFWEAGRMEEMVWFLVIYFIKYSVSVTEQLP